MNDKCPKCELKRKQIIGLQNELHDTQIERDGYIARADRFQRLLDQAQAHYDALRINSETTIGQLRQQAKHLEDRAKELEDLQDDAESIMSCLAMQARFYQRDMPLTTPVLQNGNSTLTVAVLFMAEDWYVNRLDAEKRAEWEKRAAEMRAEARKETR